MNRLVLADDAGVRRKFFARPAGVVLSRGDLADFVTIQTAKLVRYRRIFAVRIRERGFSPV